MHPNYPVDLNPFMFKVLVPPGHSLYPFMAQLLSQPPDALPLPERKLQNLLLNNQARCPLCFAPCSAQTLKAHATLHEQIFRSKQPVYSHLQIQGAFVCVIGCGFKTDKVESLRKHYLNSHTDVQCMLFGMTKPMLRYFEG
jgi:hypothetical protein